MAPALTKSGAPSNRREKIPEGTLCVVCDDLASGIHYSVASCNGCKTFFRRALVNKQTFACQFNGECLVGKNVRCVCRSCRLKKCFEQGMDPKAIQHDRDKIRYTKVMKRQKEELKALEEAAKEKMMMKIKEEIGSPGGPECSEAPFGSRIFDSILDLSMEPELRDSFGELDIILAELMHVERKLVEVRNAYRFDDQVSTIWNMFIGSRALLSEDDWLAAVTQMDPFLFSLEDRPLVPSSPYRPARITPWLLREWFQRDLTLMLEWVKLLPGGSELSTSDKVVLQKNFALTFVVYQMTFYSRDTTVLGDELPVQTPFEEKLRGIKRRATPPPPIPSLSSFNLAPDIMSLANALYNQPMAKRIREEDEASTYLRKLSSFTAVNSPSTSSFSNNYSSFLINNGLTAVTSFAESLNEFDDHTKPLPLTMSSGLPGALSSCLSTSLKQAHVASPPTYNTVPNFPTGFWNALGNSPGIGTFPASPLVTSSPLMAGSPLMGASPLMASLSSFSLPLSTTSLPFTTPSLPSFIPPPVFKREKTPDIDVETVSVDGKSEGTTEPSFRVPAIQRNLSFAGPSSVISSLNMMSMKSPDEPCSSSSIKGLEKKEVERMPSVSPDEVQMVTARIAAKNFKKPLTPGETSRESSEEKKDTVEGLTIVGEEKNDETEETPCDPTPEAQVMNRIIYPDGTFIDRDKDKPSSDEFYRLLIDGIWKVFRRLEVDQETFVLFKMMVFFNAELTERHDHKLSEAGVEYVKKSRDKMYTHLMVHLQRTKGKDGLKIYANLLLLGATVARVRHSLRKMFTMTTIFVPTNDLVDQLILRDGFERAESPSAFRHYHPAY